MTSAEMSVLTMSLACRMFLYCPQYCSLFRWGSTNILCCQQSVDPHDQGILLQNSSLFTLSSQQKSTIFTYLKQGLRKSFNCRYGKKLFFEEYLFLRPFEEWRNGDFFLVQAYSVYALLSWLLMIIKQLNYGERLTTVFSNKWGHNVTDIYSKWWVGG